MPRPVKKIQGFTLVEVVIALLILSMLMLATLSSIRTFGTTQQKVEAKLEQMNEARQVLGWLRHTISQAVPVRSRIKETGGGHNTLFLGASDELIWVSPSTFGVLGGVYIFRLSAVEERLQLQFSPYDYEGELPDWNAIEPQTLLTNLDELAIGYKLSFTSDSEWLDEWDWSMTNPAKLRINIQQNERYWPELVVRLNAGEARLN